MNEELLPRDLAREQLAEVTLASPSTLQVRGRAQQSPRAGSPKQPCARPDNLTRPTQQRASCQHALLLLLLLRSVVLQPHRCESEVAKASSGVAAQVVRLQKLFKRHQLILVKNDVKGSLQCTTSGFDLKQASATSCRHGRRGGAKCMFGVC